VTRGREPIATQKEIFSTGRGGAGNIRSPSRDIRDPITNRFEKDVINKYNKSQEDALVSSGRGGLGNINRSRSRDPASNLIYSTGRSGSVADDSSAAESINEDELKNIPAMQEKNLSAILLIEAVTRIQSICMNPPLDNLHILEMITNRLVIVGQEMLSKRRPD